MTNAPQVSQVVVSTTATYEPYGIARNLGIVRGIGTAAGKTASAKARGAYDEALLALKDAARQVGADGVVGVQISPFAAGMGGMLGDAVGIVLMGSAVTFHRDLPAK